MGERTTPLQLTLLVAIFFIAPLIGVAIGYLSPHDTRNQAKELLHSVLNITERTLQKNELVKKQEDYLTITNAAGDVVCADGQQHEVPCWRMVMERSLLHDVSDTYSPSAPEQLYGIIRERTGPNGTITTLVKKNDLNDPNPASGKHSSGSRLASAQKALSQ